MKILALMKYGSLAASTRQRLSQYQPFLAENGVTVDQHALLDNRYLERLAVGQRSSRASLVQAYARRLCDLLTRRDHDILWVHCELFPYLPGLFERLASWSGKPVVYDYDDAIFHMYDSAASPVVRRLLGGKLGPLLSRSALAIGGNRYLVDYAARFCPNTALIPTVVDIDSYLPAEPRGSAPVVGWIGSPSTWSYVAPMAGMLADFAERHGAPARIVGAGPRANGLPGILPVTWAEEREVADIQQMDIGIMPLPDEPWARGKCGYKLIQFMACGLPVIASPVGVNSEIVEHGVNGFLAETPDEWRTALDRLAADPALRQRMGKAGRERVVERYSLQSQAPYLLSLLRKVARNAVGPGRA